MSKKKNYKAHEPCVVTGECRDGYVTLHHLITKKSRPDLKDEQWNLFPCSAGVHQLMHSKGLNFMAREYDSVKEWLLENGWYYCGYLNKWDHDKPGGI